MVQAVNAANRAPSARRVLEATLGVHRERVLPGYAGAKFRPNARPSASFPVRDGKNSPGKVAIFSSCYVNYNEPGIGHDLLRVLEHNQVPAMLVAQEACCGMPKFELGDLEGVARLKKTNIPVLAPLAREGYAILTAVPSCTSPILWIIPV